MESNVSHPDAGEFADAIARAHSADANAPCVVEVVETHISTIFLTQIELDEPLDETEQRNSRTIRRE